MTSSSNYVGLFGYSTGLTIKNVILDNTCSVKSMHSGSSNAYIGSIVSCCGSTTITTTATVDIESIVNLAGITLEGSYTGFYVGGIVGATYTSANGMLIKNCVNYGAISVKASGSTLGNTDIGGIIRCTDKSNGNIQNCLNYGVLNYDESAGDTPYIGGIAGYSQGSNYTNCVLGGKIANGSNSTYIGCMLGKCYATDMQNSFWTSNVGYSISYGLTTNAGTLTIMLKP